MALESSGDLSAFANAKACRSNDILRVRPPFLAEKALVELRGCGVFHSIMAYCQWLTGFYLNVCVS